MSGAPRVPDRGRITLLALVIPLAVLVVALGWGIILLPELPSPVATHWGADGLPNGFGQASTTLWLLATIVLPLTIGMWAVGYFLGSTASTRRMAVFFSIWFAVAISGLLIGSLAMQRGVADASQAGGIGLPLGVSFGAATLLGLAAAVAVPADQHQPTRIPVPDGVGRLPLSSGEQAAWTRTVELPALPWVMGIGVGSSVLLGALALLAGRTVGWVIAVTLVLITALVVLLGRWTVTVDRAGLTARSVLPRPRTVLPLDEVESAEAIDVQPFAQFGGWGYRIDTTGRVGIVLRRGEAILVHRTGGRQLVVTVDDAATGAALLNTLADRTRLR